MRYLIVTGGTVSRDVFDTVLLQYDFDKIIACDSGLAYCKAQGVAPDVVIGDFDSADKALVDSYRGKCEFIELDTRKDFTDTHVAVDCSLSHGATEVIIIGATGTRFDHTMANVGLLISFVDAGVPAWIVDAHSRIAVVKGCETPHVIKRNDLYTFVSLVPCFGTIDHVALVGFAYDGEDICLRIGESLGISNEILGEEAHITFKDGYLAVIESRD